MNHHAATIPQPTKRRPMYTTEAVKEFHQNTSITLVVAMRIARKYAQCEPTVDELVRDHGMSRATAYRWLSAIRNA